MALRSFDLLLDFPLRVIVPRLSKHEHILLLILHQMAFDAWSARVLLGEFATRYRALSAATDPELAEIPIQYGDFAQWQRERVAGELRDRQLGYWKQRLKGC